MHYNWLKSERANNNIWYFRSTLNTIIALDSLGVYRDTNSLQSHSQGFWERSLEFLSLFGHSCDLYIRSVSCYSLSFPDYQVGRRSQLLVSINTDTWPKLETTPDSKVLSGFFCDMEKWCEQSKGYLVDRRGNKWDMGFLEQISRDMEWINC